MIDHIIYDNFIDSAVYRYYYTVEYGHNIHTRTRMLTPKELLCVPRDKKYLSEIKVVSNRKIIKPGNNYARTYAVYIVRYINMSTNRYV